MNLLNINTYIDQDEVDEACINLACLEDLYDAIDLLISTVQHVYIVAPGYDDVKLRKVLTFYVMVPEMDYVE